jgi:hypothetical protein
MVESIEAQVHKKATCSEKAHLMDNVHNQVRVMEITVRVCIMMAESIVAQVHKKATCSTKVHLTLIVTIMQKVKALSMADNVG